MEYIKYILLAGVIASIIWLVKAFISGQITTSAPRTGSAVTLKRAENPVRFWIQYICISILVALFALTTFSLFKETP